MVVGLCFYFGYVGWSMVWHSHVESVQWVYVDGGSMYGNCVAIVQFAAFRLVDVH